MRERLFTYGSKSMQSYELLEMLLFYPVQYKNTNPIAKRLMQRFGSLDAILMASTDQLCEVEGVGIKTAEYIKAVGELFLCEPIAEEERMILDKYDLVGRFLIEKFSSVKEYRTSLLLFDNKMALIECVDIYSGDYSSASVRSSELIDRAVMKHATVAITAHSHPHGPAFPTTGDMATHSAVSDAFKNVGIVHLEHYVVCGS
ncbi:MAG: RadC family protein, partial [Clostridia bacterium]|nr:RadC family protein [Clostridia bacterium]